MQISTLKQAEEYLFAHIPDVKKKYTGEWGLKKMKILMNELGNPQEQMRVIHVAGTSGKGSTAYFLRSLLHSLGFRVGLTISPHITSLCERIQINESFVSEETFCRYLTELIPTIDLIEKRENEMVTYFEIFIALAYYSCWKEKVDYMVVETGLGGLYDSTNIVENAEKLAVLTTIGYDHMEILGEKISEIAYQKAMITQNFNKVFSIGQVPQARKVIDQVVKDKKGSVTYIKQNKEFFQMKPGTEGIYFNFSYGGITYKKLRLNLIGEYQVKNAALALATVIYLSGRDHFAVEESKVRSLLSKMFIPGRGEIINKNGSIIVLDGAHNPQKMKSFIQGLRQRFPNQSFHFLLAFKKGKQIIPILREIIPVAESITLTNFATGIQEFSSISLPPQEIAHELERLGYRNYVLIENPSMALSHVLNKKSTSPRVITGSFYLLATLYEQVKRD